MSGGIFLLLAGNKKALVSTRAFLQKSVSKLFRFFRRRIRLASCRFCFARSAAFGSGFLSRGRFAASI